MDNTVKNLNPLDLDLSALDKLSPAERELALSILKEYSETGVSQQLNDLVMEDYAEVPVDILTFVDDNEYLGHAWHDAEGKSKLYPYWRKELKKIFSRFEKFKQYCAGIFKNSMLNTICFYIYFFKF